MRDKAGAGLRIAGSSTNHVSGASQSRYSTDSTWSYDESLFLFVAITCKVPQLPTLAQGHARVARMGLDSMDLNTESALAWNFFVARGNGVSNAGFQWWMDFQFFDASRIAMNNDFSAESLFGKMRRLTLAPVMAAWQQRLR